MLFSTGGCETDNVVSFPTVDLNSGYQGYIYIPQVEITKGYVKSSAPPIGKGLVPLAGGKVTIGYEEATIQNDGSFQINFDRVVSGLQNVVIYDSMGTQLTSFQIDISPRQLLYQKIELLGSKGVYKPNIYRLDNLGNVIKSSYPIADAGPDRIVLSTHSFEITGYGFDWDSNDSTASKPGKTDIIKYAWDIDGDGKYDFKSAINGKLEIGTGEITAGTYTLSFKVTDKQSQDAYDTMTLKVIDAGIEDIQPIADAGEDITVKQLQVATLDGSASRDDDNDALTFKWAQTAGPTVTLDDYSAIKPSFTPSDTGCYVFSLQVDDGKGTDVSKSEYDFVNVWVETSETNTKPDIVFDSNMESSGYRCLYSMNYLGDNLQKITTFSLSHSKKPVWSRDGNYIFFESNYGNRGWEIFKMEYSSSSIQALTSDYDNYQIAVSPTSDYIAYVSNQSGNDQIYIVDYNGNAPDPLVDKIPHRLLSSAFNQTYPSFTADGNYIVYSTDSDEVATGIRNIYKVPLLLGTGETTHTGIDSTILTSSSDDEFSASCSIDNKIVYIRTNGGYNEIWKMDLDGSNQTPLCSSSNNSDPAFTPDGEKIVFSSIRNGDSDYEIYIMDSDGSNISVLTSNSVEDSHPSYRP